MDEIENPDDLQRTFLEENLGAIADVARGGYEREGRGAVFMFEDNIVAAALGEAPAVPMEYVPDGSDALRRRGGWPTPGHAELIASYDPAGSMVILVGRRLGARDLFTHHVRFLPDAPGGPELVSIRGLSGR
jgi:hypothetical protein